MSWQATSWAARQQCGGPAGKCLLYAIANYADMEGRCWPSQARLAAETELTDRTIRTWLAKLEALGLLSVEKRRRPDGRHDADVIVLHMNDGGGAGEPPENISGGTTGKSCASHRKLTTEPPEIDDTPIENSQREPSEEQMEREGARARDRSGDGDDGLATDGRSLDDFRSAWPTSAQDDSDLVEAAWRGLATEDRAAAIDGIAAFLADARRHGRGKLCAGATYLRQRRWERLPAGDQASAGVAADREHHPAWSRPWCLVLYRRAAAARTVEDVRRVHALVQLAIGGTGVVLKGGDRLSPDDIGAMVQIPWSGQEFEAWAAWFRSRGVTNLPHRESGWFWVPARWPPASAEADEDDGLMIGTG